MNRIKFLREEKGLYQKDLAKLLNVSVPAINYYENEKRDMDTKTALILLGKSDIRNPQPNNDDLLDLAKVGFTKENYNPPTEKQKEAIRTIVETIMQDNRKEKK